MMPLLLLPLAMLSACSTYIRDPRPASECASLVPKSLRSPTPGWPIPEDDRPASWMAFGLGQSGQLERANIEKDAVIEIVAQCERRDAVLHRRLTRRKVLGLF